MPGVTPERSPSRRTMYRGRPMGRFSACALAVVGALTLAPVAAANVLRVGTYHGIQGQYKSIQAAVDAAKANDWILVGPGDYKTASYRSPRGGPGVPGGRPDHQAWPLPAGHEPQQRDRRRHQAGLGPVQPRPERP